MGKLPTHKEIRLVAWPIILSLIAQNVVNVTDTAFLGRLGPVPLGASALGGLLYIAIYMLGFGFGSGAQILISRRNGEKRYEETGRITNQTFLTTSIFGIIIIVLVQLFASTFLTAVISSPEVGKATIDYTSMRIWGLIFAFANISFRAFYVGIARTRLLGYSAFVMAFVNILLDYVLIFGHFGFPAMGIRGAALASVIAEATAVIFTLVYTIITVDVSRYKIFTASPAHRKTLFQTIDISVWVMLQNFLSLGSWFLFFVIVEKSGEMNLAISNIIRSIYMVIIIPILGFATAANTLVSNSIGANGAGYTAQIIRRVILQGFLFVMPILLITVALTRYIVQVYTNDPELVSSTVPALRLVCGVMVLFNGAYILFQGVAATGNTRITLVIEAFTIAVYLWYSWMATVVWKFNITAIWTNEYLYFILLGILSYFYFAFGNWRQKVI